MATTKKDYTIKLAIALLCISSLLIWIAFSKSTNERKCTAINNGLRNGSIGGLRVEDSLRLIQTLRNVCSAAGVAEKIVLNEPLNFPISKGKLYFYTTSPKVESVTKCDKGNAVYDATLNAIFIDNSILNPVDWLGIGDGYKLYLEQDFPFLITYLKFVVLHELGHYKLHRKSGGFYDLRSSGRNSVDYKKENEADEFALAKTFVMYDSIDTAVDAFPKNIGEQLNVNVSSITSNRYKALISLIEMGNMTIQGMLIGLSPYSPYFKDNAHPTYINRIIRIQSLIAKQSILNDTIKAKAQYVSEILTRYLSLPSIPTLEIITPRQVGGVTFDKYGLVLLPIKSTKNAPNSLCRIPYDKLQPTTKDTFKTLQIANSDFSVNSRPDDTNSISALWSASSGIFSLQTDGNIRVFEKNTWRSYQKSNADKEIGNLYKIQSQSAPSNFAVVATYGEIISFLNGKIVSERNKQDIINELQNYVHADSLAIKTDRVSIIDSCAYIPVVKTELGETSLWGVAQIDLRNLTVCGSSKILLPKDMDNNEVIRGFITVLNEGRIENILIVKNCTYPSDTDRSWSAWQLYSDKQPKKIAQAPFIINAVHGVDANKALRQTLWTMPSLWTNSVISVPPHFLIVNWDDDSNYLLDLSSGSVSIIFQPGASTMETSVSNKGLFALFFPQTNRIFVFQPEIKKIADNWSIAIPCILFSVLLILLFAYINFRKKRLHEK